jgi:hypothetical protein
LDLQRPAIAIADPASVAPNALLVPPSQRSPFRHCVSSRPRQVT